MNSLTGSRLQGKDTILVHAPPALLWRLISDSNELPNWGPPVKSVEVMSAAEHPEELGTPRTVHAEFGRKSGFFREHRVVHEPGHRVAYVIDEENFGLLRVMTRPGFSLELEPMGPDETRVVFSFFHNPRGVFGRLMNPLIKLQQRRNRLLALSSLKLYAEGLRRS